MAKTKKFTFGTYGAGTYAHIAITELNKKFGTDVGIVHYRGEAPMWQDFNAGVIQAATGSYQAASNALKSGVGIPVAVPRRRSKPLPDVKTFQELGFDQDVFKLSGFICLVGPTGMPQEAIDKLSQLWSRAASPSACRSCSKPSASTRARRARKSSASSTTSRSRSGSGWSASLA